MADIDDYLIIGRVISAHGIKGWVNVKSFTEPKTNLIHYSNCFIGNDGWKPVKIEQGREHGKGLVVKFAGINDRTAAEALCKCEIAVLVGALTELPEEEFYWHQLEGLEVWVGDKLLGKISHMIETGSNDVMVVRACKGSLDERERLLPYRPEVVKSVDLQAGKILADWDSDF